MPIPIYTYYILYSHIPDCNLIDLAELIYKNEASIRLGVFLGGFGLLAIWEYTKPRRRLGTSKLKRWLNNFGLIITSTVLVRILIPTAAIGAAHYAEIFHMGLANHLTLPFWLKFVITFVLLDLIIYFQHLFFHVLPILWRFHRVHHSDQDCDVTTGLRFHPVEILMSVVIKIGAILILGAPVLTVIVFEIVLNFMSMFTHSNISIYKPFERVLRWFITTPEMHRIHHSTVENETNSNFTFFISLWDRIFGTYLYQPEKGHTKMTLGLDRFNTPEWTKFHNLLIMPATHSSGGYVINNRDARNAEALEKINTQLTKEVALKTEKQNELILALEKAEEANKAKTTFIANMSHELRTPLHGILSFSKFGIIKIDKASKEKLLEYFKSISTSGERLLNLINDVLTISKIEEGSISAVRSENDLKDTINACINEQLALLETNELTIEQTFHCESSIAYYDNNLITQVITNLLSNAIKFSPHKSVIEVIVSDKPLGRRKIESNQSLLYFSLKDEGPGIPDDELETIFTRFSQSSRTDTGAGGTGLGLTISEDIIKAHNGEIWAENNKDENGSTFIFTLPVN